MHRRDKNAIHTQSLRSLDRVLVPNPVKTNDRLNIDSVSLKIGKA